jgi:hypothetical protein
VVGETFTDPRLCAAIVDRLTFHGTIIETGTISYRLGHPNTADRISRRPVSLTWAVCSEVEGRCPARIHCEDVVSELTRVLLPVDPLGHPLHWGGVVANALITIERRATPITRSLLEAGPLERSR